MYLIIVVLILTGGADLGFDLRLVRGGLVSCSVSSCLLGICVSVDGLPSFLGMLSTFLLGSSQSLAGRWPGQREQGADGQVTYHRCCLLDTLPFRGGSGWWDSQTQANIL